jgi:hypothetical protein
MQARPCWIENQQSLYGSNLTTKSEPRVEQDRLRSACNCCAVDLAAYRQFIDGLEPAEWLPEPNDERISPGAPAKLIREARLLSFDEAPKNLFQNDSGCELPSQGSANRERRLVCSHTLKDGRVYVAFSVETEEGWWVCGKEERNLVLRDPTRHGFAGRLQLNSLGWKTSASQKFGSI